MERPPDDLPIRSARGMLWASLGILFCVRAASGIDNGYGLLGVLLAAASYAPLIALLALHRGAAVRHTLLAWVVLLYLLPFSIVGWQWDWTPWTVAAAVLCALPARWAWPLFALLVGVAGLTAALLGHGVHETIFIMVVTAEDGLIVWSVAALTGTAERLARARRELAELALARERLRLDGELREVLGGRLQAIAFRLRKAARTDDPGARHEVREATELARRTLAEVRATADAYRAAPPRGRPTPAASRRLAGRVLLTALIVQCVLVMTNISSDEHLGPSRPGAPSLALAVLGLGAVVVLHVLPPTRARFFAQALLIVLPIFLVHAAWDRLLGYLSGSVLLRIRPPYSWTIVVLVLAAHLVVLLRETSGSLSNDLTKFGGHVMLMWLVYSLGRLTGLVSTLERVRHDLAEAVVRRERGRVARDLHDVLGYSLSAVALKGEVAARLLDSAPGRAGTELAALTELVERTMAELGSIVADRVELRLAAELDASRRMLESAGIETTARVDAPRMTAVADTELATVLRETVTNVLRHSRARTCDITISMSGEGVRLCVVNDGAEPAAGGGATVRARSGSGLGNLAQRTGGRVTAGPRSGGLFEVVAEFGSDPVGLGRDPDGVDPVPSA